MDILNPTLFLINWVDVLELFFIFPNNKINIKWPRSKTLLKKNLKSILPMINFLVTLYTFKGRYDNLQAAHLAIPSIVGSTSRLFHQPGTYPQPF